MMHMLRYLLSAPAIFALIFGLFTTQPMLAQDQVEEVVYDEEPEAPLDELDLAEDKGDINDLIMHHIADAHDWHLWDWKGHAVSVPLPVIVYTENGFTCFSSARFHHDDEGKNIVEAKGVPLVKYHEKIYVAADQPNEKGSFIQKDAEGKILNAKPLDISLTKNAASLFVVVFLMLLIFFPVAGFYRKNGSGTAPRGLASLLEPMIVFVRDDVALGNIGEKHYQRFTPYLLTLFFFVWIANMLGLVPFIPGGANLSGNIAFTMVLAVITLILTNINGSKDYWTHMIWMPGVPIPVRILLAPIELVGILTKPFALMIRLFANMTAGHIVILSLISLIFIFESVWMSPAAVILTLFIYLIKVLVALLQAYIFALLTALFIGQAVATHDAHH